jgi:hypothetical protein
MKRRDTLKILAVSPLIPSVLVPKPDTKIVEAVHTRFCSVGTDPDFEDKIREFKIILYKPPNSISILEFGCFEDDVIKVHQFFGSRHWGSGSLFSYFTYLREKPVLTVSQNLVTIKLKGETILKFFFTKF